MSKKILVLCFLCSFLFGWLINEVNLHYIRKHNPNNVEINGKSTCFDQTIFNIDNSFYLPQIKNLMTGHGFTLDPHNTQLKVRRTPVYPIFYGAHYVCFGEERSFHFIRYTQLFLFSISVVLLCISVFNFTSNKHWAVTSALLYGLSPFTVIYCYYTLTESISPFFVVLSAYTFSLFIKKHNTISLVLFGIAMGLSVLTRPVLGIILISVFATILLANFSTKKKVFLNKCKALAIIMISFMITLAPWTIRNYKVSGGEFIPLEKFYGAPMAYGQGHQSFMNWVSCWDNPANYSLVMFSNSLIENSKKNENNDSLIIENFINIIPSYAYSGYSENEVRVALETLSGHYKSQIRSTTALKITDEQSAALFDDLIKKFKSESPVTYYILTPVRLLKSIIFQSSSYVYASLNPADGILSLWQKTIKGIMLILNVTLYASVSVLLLFSNNKKLKWFLVTIFIFNFLLFMFVFRYMEARYAIPFYPLLYIALGYVIHAAYLKFGRKYVKNERSIG